LRFCIIALELLYNPQVCQISPTAFRIRAGILAGGRRTSTDP